jgi:hypothetical protein
MLTNILEIKRPHGGHGEARLIHDYITPLNPVELANPKTGEVYAFVVAVGNSRTLFTAHLDTVHSTEGTSVLQIEDDILSVMGGGVLGADDGAGVWLLLRMIQAGKPGVYMFTRGEEKGGIGAKGVAAHHSSVLGMVDRAVAFDRKATHSVITHQGWGNRCCSNQFATALADGLTDAMFKAGADFFFSPDDSGVYTDTADFVDHIGECTNISIGYYKEHTQEEHLDLKYLLAMEQACVAFDWESLPTARQPGEYEESLYGKAPKLGAAYYYDNVTEIEDVRTMTVRQLVKWVKETDAETVAYMIDDLIAMVDTLEYDRIADDEEIALGRMDMMNPDHYGRWEEN